MSGKTIYYGRQGNGGLGSAGGGSGGITIPTGQYYFMFNNNGGLSKVENAAAAAKLYNDGGLWWLNLTSDVSTFKTQLSMNFQANDFNFRSDRFQVTNAAGNTIRFQWQQFNTGLNAPQSTIADILADPKNYITVEAAQSILPAGGETALLFGSNYLNSTPAANAILGFTKRCIFTKVTALRTGKIQKLSCFVYNSYGNRNIEVGIYNAAGVLQRSTGLGTIPAGISRIYTGTILDYSIVAGQEYWLAVWGDGIDIPSPTAFNNLGGSFPDSFYCIENTNNPTNLPASFNQNFPFASTNRPMPIIGMGA